MIPFLTCLLKLLLMPRRRLFNGGCRAKEPVGAGVGCFYGRHFMDIILETSGMAVSPCPFVQASYDGASDISEIAVQHVAV